jgi:hypothetical protein
MAVPEFPSPKVMFVTPRWHVMGYVGDVLAYSADWISADTSELAIRHVRRMGFTGAVRFEATEVTEVTE